MFLFEHDESFQAGVAHVITEISLILSIWVKPYEVQVVSTMESLSLITTFSTFIAALLISHNEVATSTDMAVAVFVIGINIGFVVMMALLFLKDSSTTVLKKVQQSEFKQKLSGKFGSFRIDQTQVQSVESAASRPSSHANGTANGRGKPEPRRGVLFPIVPLLTSSDKEKRSLESRASETEQGMGVTDLGSIDESEDSVAGEELSDTEDSEFDDSTIVENVEIEEMRPHDEVRSMMLAKDDEIQELKLQLHTLRRHSRMPGKISESSNGATPVSPHGAHFVPEPTPPADVSRIEDGLDDSHHHRKRAPLPVVAAASEESLVIDREIRHGRLTDHVKSSANRGDLESFIAAT